MKYLLSLFLFNYAFAQDLSPQIRLSEERLAPMVKLEEVRIKNEPLKQEKIKALRERIQNRGGDDVGNGGDELRREFLRLAEEIIEQSGLVELRPLLDVKRLLVITDLSLAIGDVQFSRSSLVVEGMILLDHRAWSPETGALRPGVDARFQILKLLLQASQGEHSEQVLLKAWNSLKARPAKIWCDESVDAHQLLVQSEAIQVSGREREGLEQKALAQCAQKQLKNCRVEEFVFSGFGNWASYKLRVTGEKLQVKAMSSREKRAQSCEKARQCEVLHDWAPNGQVRPTEFQQIARLIRSQCHE